MKPEMFFHQWKLPVVLVAGVFLLLSMVFVYRSFYGMRIQSS